MSILESIKSNSDIKMMSYDKLNILAAEIRKRLIEVVSKNGGHLASNLGTVELTLALHKAYNPMVDKLIWDVGHQSYVHKILTGRNDSFDSLRTFGGISGYTRTSESPADCYDSGHSSTSISTALGYAHARDIRKDKYNVVAIIGDGSMTGGMIYEALNNAASLKSNITLVLNNNHMSISKNVGSISQYLNRFRTGSFYNRAKHSLEEKLEKIPYGKTLANTLKKFKNTLKYMLIDDSIFEEFGFTCIGPFDGHDIRQLTEAFEQAKKIDGPVFIHVYTKKGAGYKFAENNPSRFHGIGKFDPKTGKSVSSASSEIALSPYLGENLTKLAAENKNLVAITAAMPDGTGLTEFARKYPERFFDVGIAEAHAVTFGGGLARGGLVPVVAIYSSFLQRSYDSIVHDVSMRGFHMVLAVDRAGIVGADGESHHGLLDIAYLSSMPKVSILSPASRADFEQMLCYAVNEHKGTIAIRYPRSIEEYTSSSDFIFGKADIVREGSAVTVVADGSSLQTVIQAAKISGIDAEIIFLRTIKPLDTETLKKSYDKTGTLISVEDGVKFGGMGSLIQYELNVPVTKIGYDNDTVVSHGSTAELRKFYHTDAEGIAEVIAKGAKKVESTS